VHLLEELRESEDVVLFDSRPQITCFVFHGHHRSINGYNTVITVTGEGGLPDSGSLSNHLSNARVAEGAAEGP